MVAIDFDALTKVKKTVYEKRIRLKEFFMDFDKLRCGYITAGQFCSGLSMALNNSLNGDDMKELVAQWTDAEDPVKRVAYAQFCAEVDTIFTRADLETMPLAEVPKNPSGLFDTHRFEQSLTALSAEEEEEVNLVLEELAFKVKVEGILVKSRFDDDCNSQNSPMRVGHVTAPQFKRILDSKLGFGKILSYAGMDLLARKFTDETGMVNYIAFGNLIDPQVIC